MKTLTALLVLLLIPTISYSKASDAAQAPGSSAARHSLAAIGQTVRQFIESQIDKNKYAKTVITVGRLDSRLELKRCEQPLETFLAPGADLVGKTTVGVRCTSPNPGPCIFQPLSISITGSSRQQVPLRRGKSFPHRISSRSTPTCHD